MYEFRVFCLLTVFLFLLGLSMQVGAKPVALGSEGQVSIMLYDEPCRLDVANLPMRAVWTENGKPVEGCWGVSSVRVVMSYWADKTVAAIPLGFFKPVSES